MSDVLYRTQLTPTQAAVIQRANAFRASINAQADQLKKRRAPVLLAVIPEPPPAPKPLLQPSNAIINRIAALQEELKDLERLAAIQRKAAELAGSAPQFVSINKIQQAVCKHYGITQTDMHSERRTANLTVPRFVAAWLCRRITARSLPEIGRKFGDRDHTTILHAVNRMDEMRKADAAMEALLQSFIKQLAPWELEDCSSVALRASQPNEAQTCNSPSITAI